MDIRIHINIDEGEYHQDTNQETLAEWITSHLLDAIYDQLHFRGNGEFTINIDGNIIDANEILTHHNGIIEDNPKQIERINRYLESTQIGPRV